MKKILFGLTVISALIGGASLASANEITSTKSDLTYQNTMLNNGTHIPFENLADPQVPGMELFGTNSDQENITYNEEANQLQIRLLSYSRVNSQFTYPYPAVTVIANGQKLNTSYVYNDSECIISFTPLEGMTRYDFTSIYYVNIADPHENPNYIGFLTSRVTFSY